MIPFVNLKAQRNAYREELLEAEARVLDSGCYIGGEEVHALEQELASYTGVQHVATCASGTDALELSLAALGLAPGDEVIVPDFTFISPAEAVANLGGTPRFADISALTFLLDPECLEALITPRTVGIIAVHLFGQTAPMAELEAFAKQHNLWLLGDAAQAFGAKQNGKHSVAYGDISITSFYPTKPLGAYGDGGAVFTNNATLAERVRKLANHGTLSRYFHEIPGKNSRLDALQAAVLRVKLTHLDEEIKKRNANARAYNTFFKNFDDVQIPAIAKDNYSTYAQYTLRANERDEWLSRCDKADVPTSIYYPRTLSNQPCFASLPSLKKNARAARASHEVFSLPICPFTDVQQIIDKLKKC